MRVEDEDFGRPAESNIIYSPEQAGQSYNFGKTREPLKFEKDIEMKYSMLEPDSPELPHGSQDRGQIELKKIA